MSFQEINIKEFSVNPFTLIGDEWLLITASCGDKTNTMTASWGGLGVMWNKNVAFIVIRPTRYTKQFVDDAENFSLCVFGEEYRKELQYLGTVSGRDENKIEKAKLTVCKQDNIPYFAEAKTVILCKKLYAQTFEPNCFIDKELDMKMYPKRFDHHTMYIGEITKILTVK